MPKIHPQYSQHTTVTGRLSGRNPNPQNWPRPSNEEQRAIRNLVRARPGHVLVGADYSQGEFRIVAWLSGAKWALDVFNDPKRKIFREFAETFYGPDFNDEQYTRMKNVTYGSFYGGSAEHLATYSGNLLETKKLQRFLLREACPEIGKWQFDTRYRVIKLGETLQTVYGRKRRFWTDTLKTKAATKAVENECLAFVPQSTLSDLNCESACVLVEEGYAVRILVHDAIYVEVPESDIAGAEKYITEVMERVAAERLPGVRIPAEAHHATHWGNVK